MRNKSERIDKKRKVDCSREEPVILSQKKKKNLMNIPFCVIFTYIFVVLVQIFHCGLLLTHNIN